MVVALAASSGCYSMRPSSGGGQVSTVPARYIDPSDIAVPNGYRVEIVASGLTFPTGVCWDDSGQLHVVESGYCYGEVWTTPRLLRVGSDGSTSVVAEGGRNGPWNGVDYSDGSFYVAEGSVLEGGRILRIGSDGVITPLIEGLPSRGDHHTNGPLVHDGYIYFSQGTATNSGVVGEDNAEFGWLGRNPDFCDIPGADIELRGEVFETKDVVSGKGRAITGAFSPFGRACATVKGSTLCSGSLLRIPLEGGAPELVAWGFRNPFGLAAAPDGVLYVSDNGYDDRGSRPVWGSADHLWKIERGAWYGWPDYSGELPLTRDEFRPPGKPKLEFLLAAHPSRPPTPAAIFDVHSSADGFDFSHSEGFGHVGDAFVALLGDEAPAVGKVLAPVGFKVVRVDVATGLIEDFAVNKGKKNGPASRLGRGGLERPLAARFDPSGEALYVVDFGIIQHDDKGANPHMKTGAIWRIGREERQ